VSELKVALIVPHFFWTFGGHEYYLARELSKLDIQVKVFSSNILPTRYFKRIKKIEPREKNVDKLFDVEWFNTPLEIHQIPFFDPTDGLQEYDPDVIHCQEIFQFCSQRAFLSAKKMRIPFIFTQHKYDNPAGPWKMAWNIFRKSFGKYICNYSSHITAISNAAKQFLIHSMSLPEDHITVIPLGVDVAEFRPLKSEGACLKQRLGLEDRTVILFVGRLTPIKGVHHLVKAFAKICRLHPEACLLIRGEGEQKKYLSKFIKDHGLEHYVFFLPFFPRKMLPVLYSMSDIFVLPSLKEPFGLVLLEAMACGKPAVGTNVGGIPDIIKDGVNGFLVKTGQTGELAEKLEILIRDEEQRATMGYKARKIVEDYFDYKIIAGKTASIYTRCLRSR
jgi:glycosyltransferase involved in cell wall biosynthesis